MGSLTVPHDTIPAHSLHESEKAYCDTNAKYHQIPSLLFCLLTGLTHWMSAHVVASSHLSSFQGLQLLVRTSKLNFVTVWES